MMSLIESTDGEAIVWSKVPEPDPALFPEPGPGVDGLLPVQIFTARVAGGEMVKELWVDDEGFVSRTCLHIHAPDAGRLVSVRWDSPAVTPADRRR